MSDIREWLFAPLLEQQERIYRETQTLPEIEVSVHPDVFAAALKAADVRYGVIATDSGVPTDIRLGDHIVIKPWPQWPPERP